MTFTIEEVFDGTDDERYEIWDHKKEDIVCLLYAKWFLRKDAEKILKLLQRKCYK